MNLTHFISLPLLFKGDNPHCCEFSEAGDITYLNLMMFNHLRQC